MLLVQGLAAAVLVLGAPQITWSAPEGCPDVAVAVERIAAEVGPDASSQIDVVITEPDAAGQLRAAVSVSGPAGATDRELESPDCNTLLDAVALIAATASDELEAEVAATPPEPEPAEPQPTNANEVVPEPEPEVVPEPEPEPDEPSVFEAAAPEPRLEREPGRVSAYLRGFAVAGWGVTPVVDGGGGAAIGLTAGRVRAEAFGSYLAPTTAEFSGGARAEVRAWSVGGRGCGVAIWLASDRVSIPICGAFEGGITSGVGEGDIQGATEVSAGWLAARVGPSVFVEVVPWFSVGLSVEARAVLLRPVFEIGGAPENHQPAIIGPVGTLGAEFHFPRRKPAARGK